LVEGQDGIAQEAIALIQQDRVVGYSDQSDRLYPFGTDPRCGQHFPYRFRETPVPFLRVLLHPARLGVAGGIFLRSLAGDAGLFIQQHRFAAAGTEIAGKDVSVCFTCSSRTH
jgi:hypothetical protein